MGKSVIQRNPLLLGTLRVLRGGSRRIMRVFRPIPERHANPYATHLPVLVALAHLRPIRRVAEFGCGIYSTLTFLDRAVFPDLITLRTFENDADWLKRMVTETGDDPRLQLTYIDGPMGKAVTGLNLDEYDLIFIDDSLTGEERTLTIRAVSAAKPKTGVVVVHDYEIPLYQQATKTFIHRFCFSALNPYTGLAWNDANVSSRHLKRFHRTIKQYATTVSPENRSEWLRILTVADIQR